MIIAVVGIGGFLGGFVGEALASAGHQVLPIHRGDPLPAHFVDVLLDCNGDARRFWANANPADSFAANVASVAQRAIAGTQRLYVFMSTMDVYGPGVKSRSTSVETAVIDPAGLDVYAFHKFLAEQLVTYHASRRLILRLGTLIGPGLKKNPVFDAIHGQPMRQTADSALSLVDLAHVAKALLTLLDRDATGVYNVTAAQSITVADMLQEVGTVPVFQPELLHTDYEIDIGKLSRVMAMPDSQTMLRATLPLITGVGP